MNVVIMKGFSRFSVNNWLIHVILCKTLFVSSPFGKQNPEYELVLLAKSCYVVGVSQKSVSIFFTEYGALRNKEAFESALAGCNLNM